MTSDTTPLSPLRKGIGGAALSYGSFSLSGIGLSAVIAVVLNLLLPERKEDRQDNATQH